MDPFYFLLLPFVVLLSLITPALSSALRAFWSVSKLSGVSIIGAMFVIGAALWLLFKEYSLTALNVAELAVVICWTLLRPGPWRGRAVTRKDLPPARIQFDLWSLFAICTCAGVAVGIASWQLHGLDAVVLIAGVSLIALMNVVAWISVERNVTSATLLGLLLLGLNALLFGSTIVLWRSDDTLLEVFAGLLVVSALQGFIALGCTKLLLRDERARMLHEK